MESVYCVEVSIGGARYLDMIFFMDTSQSLRSTDPADFRVQGAVCHDPEARILPPAS